MPRICCPYIYAFIHAPERRARWVHPDFAERTTGYYPEDATRTPRSAATHQVAHAVDRGFPQPTMVWLFAFGAVVRGAAHGQRAGRAALKGRRELAPLFRLVPGRSGRRRMRQVRRRGWHRDGGADRVGPSGSRQTVPRQGPQPRPAMSENGCCVIYAPRLARPRLSLAGPAPRLPLSRGPTTSTAATPSGPRGVLSAPSNARPDREPGQPGIF